MHSDWHLWDFLPCYGKQQVSQHASLKVSQAELNWIKFNKMKYIASRQKTEQKQYKKTVRNLCDVLQFQM